MALFNLISKKDGVIPNPEAIDIIDEYKIRVGTNHKTKSRSVWFGLKDLEDVITAINGINKKDKTKFGNGVRIYFAKYKKGGYEDVNTPHGKQNYNKKRTLVIIPTYTMESTGSIFHDDIERSDVQKSLIEKTKPGKKDLEAFNHGELCPPQTGCEGAFPELF